MEEKYLKDPSFAKVSIGKRNHSQPQPLFGSHRRHERTVTLTISRASLVREKGVMHTHREKDIIEVEMSLTQYAELLSSTNEHAGADATIVYTENDGYLEAPEMPNIDAVQKMEVRQKLAGVSGRLADFRRKINAMESGKSLSATKKKELFQEIEALEREVNANIPYLMNCFSEEIDKVVNDAKLEIQARLEAEYPNLRISAGEIQGLLGDTQD